MIAKKRKHGRPHSDEKRALAIDMCALGQTNADISATLKIQRNTLIKWRTNPEFAAAVDAIHADIRDAAVRRLKNAATRAVDRLVALMDRDDEAPTQRGAALDILKLIGMQPPEDLRVTLGDASSMSPDARAEVFATAAAVLRAKE